jgi:hypothetical protein
MALQMTNAGAFGIAPQTAFESPAAVGDAYWYALANCPFGPLEGQDNLPHEIGGGALPRGRFKTGIVFGGNIDIVPRLENRSGWLLYAAFGAVSTIADTTIANAITGSTGGDSGIYAHKFTFADDEYDLPYVTAFKLLPNTDPTKEVGEIAEDCRMGSWLLTATPAAVATNRFSMLGRATADTVWDYNPGWSPTYDADDTFIVTSCSGSVKFEFGSPASLTEFDTGAVSVALVNNMLPPAQARKIGSGHPIDFPVLSRTLTVATTCFAEDYDLYVECFGGAGSGGADSGWSCTPSSGDVDITLQSAAEISGSDYHMMRFRTVEANCNFMVRPIVLQPNRPVVFQLAGTIQNTDSGRDCELWLQNGQSGYSWPS